MIGGKKKNESSREDLERILSHIEPDQYKKATVLGVYDSLAHMQDKYFNSKLSFLRKKDGMIIIIGYDDSKHQPPHTGERPFLKLNGWDALEVKDENTVHDQTGKDKLEELLNYNGAVEVDAQSGKVKSYQREIHVDIKDVAQYLGVPLTSDAMGYRNDLRKKHGGRSFKGIGTRHVKAWAASGADPDLYMFAFSKQSGTISVLKQGKIIYSSVPEEIHPTCRQYLQRQPLASAFFAPQY